MTDASMAGVFRRLAQGVHHQLAECLRISSVYLGIAVIVTVSMGFALPGLRDQALQVHKALLTALAPASVQTALDDASSPPLGGMEATAAVAPTVVAMAVPEASSNATGLLGPARTSSAPAAAAKRAGPGGAPMAQIEALRNYIARKYKVAYDATGVLVNAAYQAAKETQLDPLLVLAVIAIESRYNPLAESSVGAQGLMQVMTRVHQDKFDDLASSGKAKGAPLDPVSNIYVGSIILRDCIDRRGSVEGGLNCYVGSSDPNFNGYGAKVQAERRRLALASGVALARD